jgi:hypothetical protein
MDDYSTVMNEEAENNEPLQGLQWNSIYRQPNG